MMIFWTVATVSFLHIRLRGRMSPQCGSFTAETHISCRIKDQDRIVPLWKSRGRAGPSWSTPGVDALQVRHFKVGREPAVFRKE